MENFLCSKGILGMKPLMEPQLGGLPSLLLPLYVFSMTPT